MTGGWWHKESYADNIPGLKCMREIESHSPMEHEDGDLSWILMCYFENKKDLVAFKKWLKKQKKLKKG